MSQLLIDYLPFNYSLYVQEILPAWYQALNGDTQKIKKLIEPMTHFSIWPYLNLPEKISKREFEELVEYCLGTLRRLYLLVQSIKDEEVHFWTILSPLITALEKGEPPVQAIKFLHACMLYTLCCDLPQEEMHTMQERYNISWYDSKDTLVIGNDDVPRWIEYIYSTETTQKLWKAFFQPFSPELTQQLLFPLPYHPEEYTHERSYRSLFHFIWGGYACPSSFITWDETQQLLKKLPRRSTPDIGTMHSECIRNIEDAGLTKEVDRIREHFSFEPKIWQFDPQKRRSVFEELVKVYPDFIKEVQQKYYEGLWKIEARIMKRVEFAVSRGWGMLQVED